MKRLNCEVLEGRETPAVVALLPGDILSVTLDPGVHTVSFDAIDKFSTKATVDGVTAGIALSNPAGLPPLTVLVNGTATSKVVAQNNTSQNFIGVGGVGDDTFFGGTGAVNQIVPGPGNDLAYSIVGGSQIDTVTGSRPTDVDRIYVNPNSSVEGKPQDPVVTFFRPGRTPGTPYIAQESDGVLYITPSNNGSFVQLDQLAGIPGGVKVTYDLGDGNGLRTGTFANVRAVSYFGGSGQDVFVDNTDRDIAAYGGGGNDFLLGGFAGVKIEKGLAGSDVVLSRSRDHSDLSGNAGADTVIDFGPGDATFRIDSTDQVAGFKPGKDVPISP
jgi:hypothetical protein